MEENYNVIQQWERHFLQNLIAVLLGGLWWIILLNTSSLLMIQIVDLR